jgi:predicted transcriptional regulator of viral defense system
MRKRSLSKREGDLVLALEWEKKSLVTIKDIIRRLRCSYAYARYLAHTLHKKGWLEPLGGGHYQLIGIARGPKGVPDMNPYGAVARLFPKPYFLAYYWAGTHHGLLTQVAYVTHVLVLRSKAPMEFKNIRFKFIKVARNRFFGYKEATVMGEKVVIADVERSVLDALDRPELVGGIEAASQAVFHGAKKMDPGKIIDYLRRFNDSALARRFGYLCEALRIALPKELAVYLSSQVKKDPAYLGSPKRWGKEGARNKRWSLILNVPYEELMGEVRIG